MFRIGQKVACFDDSRMLGLIKKDQVYVIAGIVRSIWGEDGLLFAEGPEPPKPYIGFNAKYFRPVTDISMFTAMLKVQKIPEDANA